VANEGAYQWLVPASPSTTCRIRISNAAGGSPSDTSDADFSINYVPVTAKPPVAVITRPTKDTTAVAGMIMTFEGTATDSNGYIVNYVWKTGDGRTVKGLTKKFDHSYATPGTYYATLEAQDNDTLWSKPDSVKITVQPSTGVNEESIRPQGLELLPNYPNPFNAGTVLSYSIDRAMPVRLRVFGIRGEEVARLVDGMQSPGVHRIAWDARAPNGRTLASGWYVCRLETPAGVRVQKVLLLR